MNYKLKDVEFKKCEEWNFGKIQYFWRADLNGRTIVTLCRTKKECIEETKMELRKINERR